MATNEKSNQNRGSKLTPTALRAPYVKPDLKKGPMLPSITAITKGSPTTKICWVARAAFGDSDFRWIIFRAWLLEDAPTWLRALYVQRGEAVGRWLEPRPAFRAVVRAAMSVAIRRKLAG